eukprot:764376-Hanusia_phi.AAC.6
MELQVFPPASSKLSSRRYSWKLTFPPMVPPRSSTSFCPSSHPTAPVYDETNGSEPEMVRKEEEDEKPVRPEMVMRAGEVSERRMMLVWKEMVSREKPPKISSSAATVALRNLGLSYPPKN